MAVTRLNGFESAQAETDGITLTGGAYSTVQARTGARSMRCNAASGVAAFFTTGGAYGNGNERVHFGLYVATMPSVARVIAGLTGATDASLILNSTGTIAYTANNVTIGTSSTALTTGQWYWIGYRAFDGTSVACLQINGVTEVTGSPGSISTTANGYLGLRLTEASAADIYIDDLIVDNAAFLASSKVALLQPISDNTRTNWTGGISSTTNLFTAVDNIPPAGVASASETDTTNIASASNTGTALYIANMTTYTTAGVATGDTVLAVQAIIREGEDIATGTKTGSYELTSNPVIAAATFTFGGDTGAHAAEVGLWVTHFSAVAASPSVTLGSSPLMKVTKTDTTTRKACVDFMGIYMAWTPAAIAGVPRSSTYPQLLAQ